MPACWSHRSHREKILQSRDLNCFLPSLRVVANCKRTSSENAHGPWYSLISRRPPSVPQHVKKYCQLFTVFLFGAGIRKLVCRALQGNPCSYFSLFPADFLHKRRSMCQNYEILVLCDFSLGTPDRAHRPAHQVISLQWDLKGWTRTGLNPAPCWPGGFWLVDMFSYNLGGHECFSWAIEMSSAGLALQQYLTDKLVF